MLQRTSGCLSCADIMEGDKLYFIDYGLVEKYTSYVSGGAHKEQSDRKGVAGTPAFASLTVHEGCNPSRRDDIEALVIFIL